MKHYVFENRGSIREFEHDESLAVASGMRMLPEYANERVRYLQVQVVAPKEPDPKVEVRIAGAYLNFDDYGQLTEAEALTDENELSPFERETCAELAVAELKHKDATVN
jgi:hypothetical protein